MSFSNKSCPHPSQPGGASMHVAPLALQHCHSNTATVPWHCCVSPMALPY